MIALQARASFSLGLSLRTAQKNDFLVTLLAGVEVGMHDRGQISQDRLALTVIAALQCLLILCCFYLRIKPGVEGLQLSILSSIGHAGQTLDQDLLYVPTIEAFILPMRPCKKIV